MSPFYWTLSDRTDGDTVLDSELENNDATDSEGEMSATGNGRMVKRTLATPSRVLKRPC